MDPDVFTVILSHVYDLDSVYTVLRAVPQDHPFFIPAIIRLLQSPVHLWYNTDNQPESGNALKTIELLLADGGQDLRIHLVEVIRRLVIDPDGRDSRYRRNLPSIPYNDRVSPLLERASNLRSVHWGESLGTVNRHLKALQKAPNLEEFSLICDPYGGGYGTIYEDKLDYDPEELAKTIGPSLKSLSLQLINSALYRALLNLKPTFSTYTSLKSLHLDVTAGTWDWDGRGSPQEGSTNDFVFKNLGFPSVTDYRIRVSDLTLSGPKPGPLSLIDSKKLEELTIIVLPCFSWVSILRIQVFQGLSPSEYPALKKLQIIDTIRDGRRWYWRDEDVRGGMYQEDPRHYWGLVPNFLSSVQTGCLQHLTQLWVDEEVLRMPKSSGSTAWDGSDTELYTITELWDTNDVDEEENVRKRNYIQVLQTLLKQIESLRVGFGEMNTDEVEKILKCCDPRKLTQFGFEWKWNFNPLFDERIPTTLLELFEPFKKLTDLHILQPRRGTIGVFRSPLLDVNQRTIEDIEAIFRAIPSLCRVGWGLITVWERNCCPPDWTQPGTSLEVVQVLNIDQERKIYELAHVPDFYRQLLPSFYVNDNVNIKVESRPDSASEDIRKLRELLEQTLPKASTRAAESR